MAENKKINPDLTKSVFWTKRPGERPIPNVNSYKFLIRPFWLTTNNPNRTITIPAGGPSAPTPMTVSQEGPMECVFVQGRRTAPCTIEIEDTAARRRWMNRPCHINTVMGSGQRPYILPHWVFLEQRRSLTISATDLSGLANQLEFYLSGIRYYEQSAPRGIFDEIKAAKISENLVMTPYWLTSDVPIVLNPSEIRSVNFSINAEGHLEIKKIMSVSDQPFHYEIKDSRSRASLMSGTISNVGGAGTAEYPHILPTSYLAERDTVMEVVFTNDSAVFSNTIYFTFGATRIYVR